MTSVATAIAARPNVVAAGDMVAIAGSVRMRGAPDQDGKADAKSDDSETLDRFDVRHIHSEAPSKAVTTPTPKPLTEHWGL